MMGRKERMRGKKSLPVLGTVSLLVRINWGMWKNIRPIPMRLVNMARFNVETGVMGAVLWRLIEPHSARRRQSLPES